MIWRRLLVRSDCTIADLHYTLQIAFGWFGSHLRRFHIHGKDYGVATREVCRLTMTRKRFTWRTSSSGRLSGFFMSTTSTTTGNTKESSRIPGVWRNE